MFLLAFKFVLQSKYFSFPRNKFELDLTRFVYMRESYLEFKQIQLHP